MSEENNVPMCECGHKWHDGTDCGELIQTEPESGVWCECEQYRPARPQPERQHDDVAKAVEFLEGFLPSRESSLNQPSYKATRKVLDSHADLTAQVERLTKALDAAEAGLRHYADNSQWTRRPEDEKECLYAPVGPNGYDLARQTIEAVAKIRSGE